jgi:hypothetical protein
MVITSGKTSSVETELGAKLSIRNYDTHHKKFELIMKTAYPIAGGILEAGEELTPVVPPPPVADMADATQAEQMLYSAELKDYVSTKRVYNEQKQSIAGEIEKILSEELKRIMEQTAEYEVARKERNPHNPLAMWKAIHDKCAAGVHFTYSNFALQIKKITSMQMSEKESLAAYRHRFTQELIKADIMAKKTGLDVADYASHAPTLKLHAVLFLEGLTPRFDALRRDLRSETIKRVKYPNNMEEAGVLAEKYDGLKGEILTIRDSSQNEVVGKVVAKTPSKFEKSKNNAKNSKDNKKEENKSHTPAEKKSGEKRNETRITYTDPNKPPPKPWTGMAYCKKHKRWCKHSTEECTLTASSDNGVHVCLEESDDLLTDWEEHY